MAATQLMIFTAIPHCFKLNPSRIPVSVVVSPRLRGADRLGAYPDWLHWTARRADRGLRITFECQGNSLTIDVQRGELQPALWEALFDEDTRVRPYEFDDYSDRFISSFPVRAALGLLKATYQTAGLAFGEPTTDQHPGEGQSRRRALFESLVRGFAVNWSERIGDSWRAEQMARQRILRDRFGSLLSARGIAVAAALDTDGLFRTGVLAPGSPGFSAMQTEVVQQFGVFSHMPPGAPVSEVPNDVPIATRPVDPDTVLDFHRALSSLNAYRVLQRRLGLAFDLELPADFIPQQPALLTGELRITRVDGRWSDTPTTIPVTSTAYVHTMTGNTHLFAIAPRQFVERQHPLGSLGLLNLDPARYGLAQVDIDGALHKTTGHADTLTQSAGELPALHPEVFDPGATLSSLRSGGISVFAEARALSLLDTFDGSRVFNEKLEANQPQPRPFCAEDVTRGYRLDVWDTVAREWHSLHRRKATYKIPDTELEVSVADEEGFFQVAATQQAPEADGSRARNDLHLHEALVRWDGWSLSADMPNKHLTRAADPDKAVPDAANPDPENQPVTPFKMTTSFKVMPGTLPRLRYGAGYRVRARTVDLAGNGLNVDDAETKLLTPGLSLPRGSVVVPYLRFEPVAAPFIVMRDARSVTGEGSSIDRLVIRTFNANPAEDGKAADLTAADRHIAPPRASVELAERHGMFDDAGGKLDGSAAMWNLIKQRDEGHFPEVLVDTIVIDGEKQSLPLMGDASVEELPYLPDPLARGAALRDLPGTLTRTVARVEPGPGPAHAVAYETLEDSNPRPGSATIVGFGGRDDWQEVKPFRIALDDGDAPPRWDAANRLLTVFLPKGRTQVVPLSSCADPEDLKLLGVWQWLREYIDYATSHEPEIEFFQRMPLKDRVAHILQLAIEGGHGMLTPPHLLTLVHAVQQPLGRPGFSRLNARFDPVGSSDLQTASEARPTAETELEVASSWRVIGGTDAWLVCALQVHGASTAKVDIHAEWTDPIDDPTTSGPSDQHFAALADEVPLNTLREGYLTASGGRAVGYYDPDHDLMCFAPAGTSLGNLVSGQALFLDAAPCHRIGDPKHHVVRYTAIATSRYRECFPQKIGGADVDFTRRSEPVTVHVPSSVRPVAPHVLYVVPTFGWQRETETNQKRSVRIGGGVRIYLDRPWYSSGVGELLGVALWTGGAADREDWKAFITQWGQDPIWESAALDAFPRPEQFTDAVTTEYGLPLDALLPDGNLRIVNIVGHQVQFDSDRKLWYCDLTVNTERPTYAPFVRLALARYQPYALRGAKVSRVVLADFAQLTPERTATVTADPFTPGRLRVSVSGPAPRGPLAAAPGTDRPTAITVAVQERDSVVESDLAWKTVGTFAVERDQPSPSTPEPDFILWTGTVRFLGALDTIEANRYRLLIQEHEYMFADGPVDMIRQSRLVYAETIALDAALLNPPPTAASHTTLG
jgi:hypothetical protein